jgi:hypothetical protein
VTNRSGADKTLALLRWRVHIALTADGSTDAVEIGQMPQTLPSAGFIVADDTAIWGVGETRAAAWADMLRGMAEAGIRVLGDGEEKVDEFEATTEASSFHTRPATAALIAAVENNGGSFAWGEASGVACTREEEAAAYV